MYYFLDRVNITVDRENQNHRQLRQPLSHKI